MTQPRVRDAENFLGHPLPDNFVEYVTNNARLLNSNAAALERQFCFTADDLEGAKIVADSACDCVGNPPVWLSEFFVIGDDGGGGFYFMRRDGDLQVWLMDSNWSEPPVPFRQTLSQFVDWVLNS